MDISINLAVLSMPNEEGGCFAGGLDNIDDLIVRRGFIPAPKVVDCLQSCKKRHNRGRRSKKKRPVFKHNMDIKEVVLDYDDLCGHIASLQKWVVMGRWLFPENLDFDTSSWIGNQWKPIIGYIPKVSILINGWFSVHFMDDKDVFKIISRT